MRFIRRVGGRVFESWSGATPEWLAAMNAEHPGAYFEDDSTTPLSPIPTPVLPAPVLSPYPSLEELTDALLDAIRTPNPKLDAIRVRIPPRS